MTMRGNQAREKPRDANHDPFTFQFAQVDHAVWKAFRDACIRNGHLPAKAIETLMRLYIEDASFSPQPTSNNNSD